MDENVVKQAGGLSEETEKLLKRYLRLEIAAKMCNMAFRLIMIGLVGFSVVFSTTTLLPKLMNQLGSINNIYPMMQMGSDTSGDVGNVNDILDAFGGLSEEQQEMVITQVRGVSTSSAEIEETSISEDVENMTEEERESLLNRVRDIVSLLESTESADEK